MSNETMNQDEDASIAQSHSLPEAPTGFEERANLDFPVVGIGASAGGIDALSKFFQAVPVDSGIAFVVIQHLPPDTRSHMPEILSRCTALPVKLIEDGMALEPNTVYAIRPGFTVTLTRGVLRLGEPVEKRGHRRPVDDFFRSLALEQKEKAIAVVLSGTGTNGTAGAQAVKAAGGLCVAQNPDSAEFPGMPHSLIRAGYADQVLSPDAIPPFLVRFVRHPSIANLTDEGGDVHLDRATLAEIHALLRTRTGHDFRGYRKPTVLRRIERRMGVAGVTRLPEYAQVLREKEDEAAALANDLMINVTGFFRDPDAWEALRDAAIVPLVENQPVGTPIRAWVAACASGEEPYSLAMLIAEECERLNRPFEAKIFASDTAEKSLALARAGVYAAGIEGDISEQRLRRFFDKDEHTYRIKKEIRDAVVFAPQNLLHDPPFSRVDVCTCRNLLIYLEPETQRHILALLSFAVRNGGYLFLGNTESLGVAEQYFETLSKRWRIYRRVGALQHRLDAPFASGLHALDAVAFGERATDTRTGVSVRGDRFTSRYERALLEEFAPPTVIIDHQEKVVFIHGDITPFLTLPPGELTTSIADMARPPLRAALRAALRQASAKQGVASVESPLDASGGVSWVRVTAAAISGSFAGISMRVSFELQSAPEWSLPQRNADRPPGTPPLVIPLDSSVEEEVRTLRRELQASIEAFEASNEELKSSNEEVLSINEELQSANEELETGKEEVQSINEELTTLNAQLQTKITELEQTTDDLANLLSSTSIAVVFLDTTLLVRRFTPAVHDLIDLIPADIGRPLNALSPKFSIVNGNDSPHEVLSAAASSVLDNLTPVETEVRSHSGRWYLHRTLPYRTSNNRIAGVVLTFVDITRRRQAELALAQAQGRLEAALEHNPAAIVMVEIPTSRVLHINRRAAALFNQPYPLPLPDMSLEGVVGTMKGWNARGRLLTTDEWPLARSVRSGESIAGEEIEINVDDGVRRVFSVSSETILNEAAEPIAALAAFWDITDLKDAEKALRNSERRLRLIVESAKDFAILMLDTSGCITAWRPGAEHIFGWEESEVIGQPGAIIFTPADRDAGVPEREMRTALRVGHAMDDRWHLRMGGTTFWANGVLSVARDDAGQVQGFVKIMRDNTDRKETEDQLRVLTEESAAARVRAEAANRSKDDFISMVSHELRAPLNTMRLWMRLLRNEALPARDKEEGRRVVERAIDAQQQLIDDLLDVSRISVGKLRLDVRRTRLAEAIGAAVDAVRPVSEGKGVKIAYRASPSVGVVRADPDRIQQVLWNLLSNAVKFTDSGGQVDVDVEREGDAVVITVSDTGIGIRGDLLPHVFERFQQGESGTARHHTGLGLGLAIAKELVELHGGSIAVTSEGDGKGSCFIVRLPLKADGIEADSPPASRSVAGKAIGAGLRILLVEDDGVSREAAQRLLEGTQAEVEAVESAAAARDAYAIRRPDLIISDIGMPGQDGYQLIQQIRALEKEHGFPRVPALALSAFARAEDRKRCLETGYDAHLAKPIDPDRLFQEIAQLTDRRAF
jgi:two-component system, chemotaxis family, CheB/CheR fusion protein